MVGYVSQFDVIYWYKLFGTANHPCYWVPVDFASVLFGMGIDPESLDRQDEDNLCREVGIDRGKYRKHHALDDARLLREIYLKFAGY